MAEEKTPKVPREQARKALTRVWRRLLSEGKKAKERFNKDAAESMRFYDGPHEKLFSESELLNWEEWPRVTVNKTFEVVAIMGPALYHKNPVRTMTTQSEDLLKQAVAQVGEIYLNYTPDEVSPSLKEESRKAIDESFIKGRGVAWTTYDEETGLIGTEFVSVDDILIDPDARDPRLARWVARRRIEPDWMVRELFPEREDDIKSYISSTTSRVQGEILNRSENAMEEWRASTGGIGYEGRKGVTSDLIVYWEIFSKMGNGFRATQVGEEFRELKDDVDEKHIIIADGIDVPLHVGDWPAPLFMDNEWFHSFLDLVRKPNDIWPLAYIKPALGEQKALDFLASLMLAKAKNSSRELVGVKAHLDEEDIEKIREGRDREVITVKSNDPGENLRTAVDFLQPPPMSPDIMNQFRLHLEMFESRTGLGELLYGQTRNQMRSAREAEIKDRNSRLRVEDMAHLVEEWQARIARKEMILARFLLEPEDILRVVGPSRKFGFTVDLFFQQRPLTMDEKRQAMPAAAKYYATMEEAQAVADQISMGGMMGVSSVGGMLAQAVEADAGRVWADAKDIDAETIVREYQIRIESTSARKPDRNWQIDQADFIMQNVALPALNAGDIDTYNAALREMYEAMEVPPQRRVFLNALPAPAPPGPEGGGGGEPPPEDLSPLPVMPGTDAAVIA